MQHATSPLNRSFSLRWIGGFVPVGVVLAVFAIASGPRSLSAATDADYDADGDGLPDLQEQVLRTSPTDADTDGDGFADGIEFARQSSMVNPNSVPLADYSVRVSAHSSEGLIHLVTAIYAADGRFDAHTLRFGMLVNGRARRVTPAMMSDARIEQHDGLMVIDWSIPAGRIEGAQNLSFFAALAYGESHAYDSASVVDLRSSRRIVYMTGMDAANRGTGGYDPGNEDADMIGLSMSSTGGGSVGSLPLPTGPTNAPGGAVPRETEPGSICETTSSMIGSNGGMVEHEITTAECVDGFDSFCDVSCFDNVGRTYWSVDPIVIVGG